MIHALRLFRESLLIILRKIPKIPRKIGIIGIFTVAFIAIADATAGAEYRGSDLFGNIGPESMLGGGFADRYPLSAYAIDYHVDTGIDNLDGIPPLIAQWAAAQLWDVTRFMLKTVVDVFSWAFSLDLINGEGGALRPVAAAIGNLNETLGDEWLIAAIIGLGIWALWKGLAQRRYTQAFGQIGLAIAFVVVAMFFVYQPERTIGQATKWTNDLSLAFLSGTTSGSLQDTDEARTNVADHLFVTLVYNPWLALEFGGLSHCVDTGRTDEDGFPAPVGPHDPKKDICRDHSKQGRDGKGGYGPRFLRYPIGSDERNAYYKAIKDGEKPTVDVNPDGSTDDEDLEAMRGWEVDKADSPAVDIQQQGGAYQRLTLSVIIFLGALGAVLLLGSLSLAVVLAMVIAMVWLAFAPVAMLAAVIPATHNFFKGWLLRLGLALFIKALYSLVLAVVLAVSGALALATTSMGFLFAFGLQSAYYWAIFLNRKKILAMATSWGDRDEHDHDSMAAGVATGAAAAAAHPFQALTRRGSRQQDSVVDEADPQDGRDGTDGTDGERRYDMAKQGTHGSREWQEGEGGQLDGRDPRFGVHQNGSGNGNGKVSDPGNFGAEDGHIAEEHRSGLVPGSLAPAREADGGYERTQAGVWVPETKHVGPENELVSVSGGHEPDAAAAGEPNGQRDSRIVNHEDEITNHDPSPRDEHDEVMQRAQERRRDPERVDLERDL